MIPKHELDNPKAYAYVNGCRNALWLTADLVDPPAEGQRRFTVTRDGKNILPILLEKGDNFPPELQPGQRIKLVCHISSTAEDEETAADARAMRYVHLVAKYIGRPSVLEDRPDPDILYDPDISSDRETLWLSSIDLPRILSRSSNVLELAGFVDGAPLLVRDPEDVRRDRLIFFLRQSDNPRHLLPVEIIGKHAQPYRRLLIVGMAVFISGIIMAGRRADTGEIVARVCSNHIRNVIPERDFQFTELPLWVVELRKRTRAQLEQERLRQQAKQAAAHLEQLLA